MVNIYFYPLVRAALASHTRLRQLADFPLLILRSSFAQPSLNLRSRFAGGNYEF